MDVSNGGSGEPKLASAVVGRDEELVLIRSLVADAALAAVGVDHQEREIRSRPRDDRADRGHRAPPFHQGTSNVLDHTTLLERLSQAIRRANEQKLWRII